MMQRQASRGYSLIQDSGAYSSSCGYCNNIAGDQSTTHGMHAYRLTVYDYQELLDQGWRRSGKFLYKPNNKSTCCRQYTIRLNVDNFQPTKTHKRLLRKWDQFLAGQLQHGQGDVQMADSSKQQQQQQQQCAGSSSQCGSKRLRQTSCGSMAAAAGASSARDGATTANTANVMQQEQQQWGACAWPAQLLTEVQSLLQQAVSQLLQQGQLPEQQQLPAVKVLVPQPQKLAKLPAGTVMMSSCAHALAAAARKWRQQQQEQAGSMGDSSNTLPGSAKSAASAAVIWSSADDLAQVVVDAFHSIVSTVHMSAAVTARAAKGHINFSIEQQQQQQQQLFTDSPSEQQTGQQQQHSNHSHTQLLQQQEQKQEQGDTQQQEHRQAPCHEAPHPQQQQQQQHHAQAHRLEVRMVPNQFIQAEYELYCKYQINQHHDAPEDLTPARYKNFLVDTPLVPVLPPPAAAAGRQAGQAAAAAATAGQQVQAAAVATSAAAGMPPCGYGSFHQQYWLDGKLVAVGVVDVLPRCLSSKYFFWDPDYAWLSLGRYGALREISWVRAAHAAGAADLQYYYLGYYIHTCPKMAYKAEYAPSELLCPQRQVWVKVDQAVLQALDRTPYVVLSDLPGVQMQPNLSVPRAVPQGASTGTAVEHAEAAAAAGGGGGGGSSAVATALETLLTPSTGATAADGAGATTGSSYLQSLAAGPVPQDLSLQGQMAAQQQQRQALDSQLLFLLKQPVRWGAVRESGMLDREQVVVMEERLQEWRAAVGETAAHLLYVTTDLL